VHHAVFRILYPLFDSDFIFDSYSCRQGKGTHWAVLQLEKFTQNVSRNYRQACFALKCDVSKFFASVDHQILKSLIARRISDSRALDLIYKIIDSFFTSVDQRESKKGLPIGNLTSQLFANIYLNKLDRFIKHKLRVRYYLRYTDDFILVHKDESFLKEFIPKINNYLHRQLKLKLHPGKIILRKLCQGIDFLGYVVLPHHKVLRTKTKRRMFKNLKIKFQQYQQGMISKKTFYQTSQSYLGLLNHCNSRRLKEGFKRQFMI
jgi:retron-type reverse transcriptase